jgi:diadenosine tetraphosphatase ApaH/serine/threonine PP2A family protein phosphatase
MTRVQVICFFYNEETLARLFVQHYAWADEILAVVSRSSDRTRECLEAARNVRVIDFEFPAGMDDRMKTDKVNDLLGKPSEFDWKIVVDADEFIWPSNNQRTQDYLASVPARVTVVEARMRNVFRHHSEADLDLDRQPVPQRTHGDPNYFSEENVRYQKPIVIRAGHSICLDLGNHRQSGGIFDHAFWFAGAHWQNADPSFAVTRRTRDRRDRQSEANLRGGYGVQHHRVTEEEILALCAARRNCPKIIRID